MRGLSEADWSAQRSFRSAAKEGAEIPESAPGFVGTLAECSASLAKIAAVALGDLDLDLREATIDLPQTAVTTLVAFGNADIYVPDGVNVVVGGFGIFGHRNEWGQDNDRPDAPTVRVRAFSLFGTVDVWRVPHDMQGGYGDIFRQLQKRQREIPG